MEDNKNEWQLVQKKWRPGMWWYQRKEKRKKKNDGEENKNIEENKVRLFPFFNRIGSKELKKKEKEEKLKCQQIIKAIEKYISILEKGNFFNTFIETLNKEKEQRGFLYKYILCLGLGTFTSGELNAKTSTLYQFSFILLLQRKNKIKKIYLYDPKITPLDIKVFHFYNVKVLEPKEEMYTLEELHSQLRKTKDQENSTDIKRTISFHGTVFEEKQNEAWKQENMKWHLDVDTHWMEIKREIENRRGSWTAKAKTDIKGNEKETTDIKDINKSDSETTCKSDSVEIIHIKEEKEKALLFMPHCEIDLYGDILYNVFFYEQLLYSNVHFFLKIPNLIILGNSFINYKNQEHLYKPLGIPTESIHILQQHQDKLKVRLIEDVIKKWKNNFKNKHLVLYFHNYISEIPFPVSEECPYAFNDTSIICFQNVGRKYSVSLQIYQYLESLTKKEMKKTKRKKAQTWE